MGLSIGLLGPLVIESEESGLGKIPKKARALLAYLAAQGGQAVSRERLADLLWPYQGSEQARHSLRNCLLELRKALRPEAAQYLVCDFAHCRLRDVAVDLDRFERSAREPQRCELQTAADLYRGEFLADFHIDSEPFQEWLAAERDRALALVCEVLQRLTATAEPGESEAAIQSGRRLVALDSLSEYGQRALMRAYARAGRRGEALRQYKSCAEILKRELGVAPDAETQALAAEIARPGSAEEAHGAGRGGTANGPAETAGSREQPPHPSIGPPAAPSPGTTRLAWPCLLLNIAVAVAPLRNLTGDPEQQYLVEAFTDDLVTDLLRHSRGLSLKPIADARGVSGGLPREPENGLEFVVTGSAQRSTPGMLRVNRPPSICGRAVMSSARKSWPRSRPRLPAAFRASCTSWHCRRPAAAPPSLPGPSSASTSAWRAPSQHSAAPIAPRIRPRGNAGFSPRWRGTRATPRRWLAWRAPASSS